MDDRGGGERRAHREDRRAVWRGGRRAGDIKGRPVVLLVDDHADSREVLATVLGNAGVAVAEAGTADAALRRLAEPPLPVAIVVDLELPDLHGAEVVKRIKGARSTAHLPVIVLSASVTLSDQQLAADAGAAAFVRKPVLPEEMLALVRRIIAQV